MTRTSQPGTGQQPGTARDSGADGRSAAGQEAPPAAPRRPTFSDRLPRPWLFPLLVFAGLWVAIPATWQVANLLTHQSHGWTFYFWYRDSGFYGNIARHWYAQRPGVPSVPSTAAFFPVYPATIRLASFLAGGRIVVGGLIATIAAGAAAMSGVWKLAERIQDRWLADRAVLLFAAFPGATTLGMMYSEPLGIALAVWCLIAVLDRHWVTAGLLAALGSGEHPTLIVLTPVLAVSAILAVSHRGHREWRALIAPLLAPLGMIGYFAVLGHHWHDYFFWSHIEKKLWGHNIDFGYRIVHIFLWSYPHMDRLAAFFAMAITLVVVAFIGIGLMLAARVPLPVSLFTIGVLASLLLSSSAGPTPRYIWPMIGIFVGGAARLPRWLYWPVLAVSLASMLFLLGWWPLQLKFPPP
jgi:hypothetical protein